MQISKHVVAKVAAGSELIGKRDNAGHVPTTVNKA